ncbi:MAG: sn-glycerol-3-phosphate ABC transporter ATP-binding protein UgpC [Hyphomicrobiales bacterium]|nr:sn-glycerol-3-phosphate ABC transporter ATP-binding protein UgpC [Hyphomicrobiales bacterium]
MASITLDNLTKVYPNDVTAVRGVSLDIQDGEFMILLGPSGCGKSTTLRMIAGLEVISSGDLFIGGRHMNNVDPAERDIAIVFQNYALYPHMTVAKNLAFGLKLRHVAPSEIENRITQVATLLGIEPLLARKPSQLSGGQRQRVALGRALVREPQAFLLDEPLSNLDATLRSSMRTELIKLHQSLGTTIVHVTHDQVEAMTMGERICIMKDGDIVQVGAPMEVYRNPANTFVASFLATPPMNLLPGRIENADQGGLAAIFGNSKLGLPTEYCASYASHSGKPVIIGLRPEDFHIAADSAPHTSPIELVTVTTEVLGPEVILVASLTPGGPEIHTRMPRDFRARPGQALTLHFDLSEIQIFDPVTTRVLTRPAHP